MYAENGLLLSRLRAASAASSTNTVTKASRSLHSGTSSNSASSGYWCSGDLPGKGKSNPGIELRQINPTGKSLLIFRNRVKLRNQKYSAFAVGQISARTSAVLPTEGRAHVTNAERDAVDAAASGEQ